MKPMKNNTTHNILFRKALLSSYLLFFLFFLRCKLLFYLSEKIQDPSCSLVTHVLVKKRENKYAQALLIIDSHEGHKSNEIVRDFNKARHM